MGGLGGLFGLLILVADIWAVVNIFKSRSAMAAKVLWTVFILFFPLVGFIAWILLGPRPPRS